jgi:hypothetical protein
LILSLNPTINLVTHLERFVGEIYDIRTKALIETPSVRSCLQCDHAYIGNHGVYCGFFKEEVYDEAEAAAACEEYKG